MLDRIKKWTSERFGIADMWFEVWLCAILIVVGAIFISLAIAVQQ